MNLALAQMDIVWQDKETNKSRVKPLLEEAKVFGADFVVFPKMSLTGFSMDLEACAEECEETVRWFSEVAQDYREEQYYQPGDRPAFCSIEDHPWGGAICYDLRFPELFQVLSKKADAILVIANWPAVRSEHWKVLLRARAIETQSFVVGVNRVGVGNGINYSGDSMVVSPRGEIITPQYSGQEKLILCHLDLQDVEKARGSFPIKTDRKEPLYQRWFDEV